MTLFTLVLRLFLSCCKINHMEIKDYIVLQKTQAQDNRLPPPHTLIMDFTMTRISTLIMDFTLTRIRFGFSHFRPRTHPTTPRLITEGYGGVSSHREAIDHVSQTNLKGDVGLIITKHRICGLQSPLTFQIGL